MTFGDRISQLRSEKGLSHSQLAAIFNKSEGAVRSWEAGRTKPDVDTLLKLVCFFECTADYLLGITEYRNIESKKNAVQMGERFVEAISNMDNSEKFFQNVYQLLKVDEYFSANNHWGVLRYVTAICADVAADSAHYLNDLNKKQEFIMDPFLDIYTMINTGNHIAGKFLDSMFITLLKTCIEYASKYAKQDEINTIRKLCAAYLYAENTEEQLQSTLGKIDEYNKILERLDWKEKRTNAKAQGNP